MVLVLRFVMYNEKDFSVVRICMHRCADVGTAVCTMGMV